MLAQSCPCRKTIDEIYGGYEFFNDTTVVVGGADIVLEDSIFYISKRKLELARLKISGDVNKFYDENYKWMENKTNYDIYKNMLKQLHSIKILYDIFTEVINKIDKVEYYMCINRKKNTNVSLPEFTISPIIDGAILVRPDLIYQTICKIISFVTTIHKVEIKPISKFDKILPTVSINDFTKSIDNMENMLNQEIKIADFVLSVEKYHIEVINKLNEISHIIDDFFTLKCSDNVKKSRNKPT
jgi:hypothetical protein